MKTIRGKSIYSWILVALQFVCLFAIFLTGPLIAKNPFILALETLAVVLGIWSVFLMDPQTINVFPEVRKDAQFLKSGPYRFIRHPMYLAVILLILSLLLEKFTLPRLVIFIILVADLLIKIRYEEKILISKYPGYKEYSEKVKKLIPFIY
jgi:protein-S-isoprenylcysteine O-methyltransferase Ste14